MSKPAAAPRTETPAPILLREDRDGIALLTLNRPEARNALSSALIDALADALASIRANKSVRAVMLTANGPVFSAGHDVKEMTARRGDPDDGRAYFHKLFARSADMMLSMVQLPQPVIACVQGTATAAGCQLVASCDLAVAAETARFATPGVQIGLFCSAPMVPLSRKVASNHALEMLLTGEPISARRAHEIGLVNRVASGGKEREEAFELARTIAQKSSYIIKIGKEAYYKQLDMDLVAAYRYGAAVMAENMLAHDAAEGIGAFIEKRAPKWEDR